MTNFILEIEIGTTHAAHHFQNIVKLFPKSFPSSLILAWLGAGDVEQQVQKPVSLCKLRLYPITPWTKLFTSKHFQLFALKILLSNF